ncbi:L-threonylcarbamoyladenylate synthase [Ignicoccus hospitalis]|uniref:L-threonylcarbamoyladenylate synthase n=1 Tax=Ignicoccus hospitalis (strain KIN4/I / DSM 18386 / JCM 14125) TaxID=453591 RepID=A8A9F4_IGNH4|nr:L-threonylcarbamoyladenylate synthase [Ignicoccus hospitalis]ABU81556.1 translation factor SUA5 [Ignicoccus hospitalis KIN4/I]HIH90491.1 threonylcarbamoyl-AMP synthase [Desulfurococcaceae archaeon]
MRVLRPRSEEDVRRALIEAKEVLESGGLVIIPTETVYGIASKLEFAEKIYEAKRRPRDKPLPVQTPLGRHREVGEFDEAAEALAKAFWPGPLTIVVKAKPWLPEAVTAGTGKVGVRVPAHPFALKLLELVGPLAVTSANLSGGKSPKSAEEVTVEADLLIDMGPVEGTPSTVVEVEGKKVKVLRRGPISEEEIQKVLSALRS